jgi:hypothetical protein
MSDFTTRTQYKKITKTISKIFDIKLHKVRHKYAVSKGYRDANAYESTIPLEKIKGIDMSSVGDFNDYPLVSILCDNFNLSSSESHISLKNNINDDDYMLYDDEKKYIKNNNYLFNYFIGALIAEQKDNILPDTSWDFRRVFDFIKYMDINEKDFNEAVSLKITSYEAVETFWATKESPFIAVYIIYYYRYLEDCRNGTYSTVLYDDQFKYLLKILSSDVLDLKCNFAKDDPRYYEDPYNGETVREILHKAITLLK